MRSLNRNKSTFYYAHKLGEKPIVDEMGNYTSETETEYTEPQMKRMNVSVVSGQDVVQAFGNMTEYSRVISTTEMDWEVAEGDIVWIERNPESDKPNYVVQRVAKSLNSMLVALKETKTGELKA